MTPELWEALLNGLKLEKEEFAAITLLPIAFFGLCALFYFLG